jgi:hypothetical protein
MRMRARIAWFLVGVTVVLVLADAVLSAQAVSLISETAVAVHGFPFLHGAALGSVLMGALIISRYDRHPIGWLLLFTGITTAVSLLAEAYAYWVQEADGPGPDSLAAVSAWISFVLGGQLVIAALALLFLLAPDGQLLSRRWRYAAWVAVLGAVLCLGAILSMNPTEYELLTAEEDMGLVRGVALSVGFLAIVGALVASVVSMLQRLRRSSGEERQQVRLIALAAGVAVLGIVTLIVVQALNGGEQSWGAGIPLFLGYFALPILFAVAVLRHHLYEIDVILNRTAVVAAATVFAALGYTTLVVAVGQQAGGFWFSLLVTALVAVAFQPVRRQVVRLVNRLVYGERAQPYEELADFSSRLVETPSAQRLLPVVAAAAGQALAAKGATARLGADSAQWGETSGTETHAVPVGESGAIEVALPKGRRLRRSDELLLEALADQAAVAFRNVALEAELAEHVAELDRTTVELSRSRARLVEADDAVRRDLEEAISHDVLPHLAAVTQGLRSDVPLERMVDDVNAALESLRELTRGVFPMQLTRVGLRALPASVSVDPMLDGRRFAPRVEAALYFCCAKASAARLTLDGPDLLLTVHGPVGDVRDRVEAAGGILEVDPEGYSVRIPADDQASTSRSGPNAALVT